MKLERVEEIYKAMEGLVIALDRDPAARGPQYLQDLISKTRGFLNQTSFFLQETLRERHSRELDLESNEADFQIQADELLANDRRVNSLPNIDDRKAMINVLLSATRREIQSLKYEIKNLGHVEKAIKLRHKELENTMSAIRLQRGLIESELRTGSFYGDETETARGWGRGGKGSKPDELNDIEDLDAVWKEQFENVAELPRAPEKVVESEPSTLDSPVASNGESEEKLQAVVAPELVGHNLDDFISKPADDPAVEQFLTGEGPDDFDDILATI